MKRLELNRLYHCRLDGANQTGHFEISDDRMRLRLFDYDDHFYVDSGTVLHARLETNRVISFLDTVSGGTGTSTSEDSTINFATIDANIVVIGPKPWNPVDPIKRVSFQVKNLKDILWNQRKIQNLQRIGSSKVRVDSELFSVKSGDMEVRCSYGGTGSLELGFTEWWPIFNVEFDVPRTIDNYLDDIHRILRFFSAAVGFLLVPSDISISSFGLEEQMARLEKGENVDQSQVEYIWHPPDIRPRDLGLHYSFVNVVDRHEIRNLESCLTAWLDRPDVWEEPNTLMMGSLALHNQTSGERLLTAYRWLERIPSAKIKAALSEDDVEAVTKVAIDEANNRGISIGADRIRGALKWIKYESNREWFSRLVALVGGFNASSIDDETINDLMEATAMRGKVAHGLFDWDFGEDFNDLHRATCAVEALSYLLMLADLPMSPAGRKRAVACRIVRDYGYSKLAPRPA